MTEVSASLLAADYARLGDEVIAAREAGVDSFHLDFMDGGYVANYAFTPQHLSSLRPYTQLPFHIHLELQNPDRFLDHFMPLDADLIVVQWDTLVGDERLFDMIKANRSKIGVGLNPGASLDPVVDVIEHVDVLLLLGVEPGFGGQPMRGGTIEMVRSARALIVQMGLDTRIAVDGGVKIDNAGELIEAGADLLVIGTGLFDHGDMASTVSALHSM